MKRVLQLCGIAFFTLLANSLLAQQKMEYLDAQTHVQPDSVKAKYTRTVEAVSDTSSHVTVKHITGEIFYTGYYSDRKLEVPHGNFVYFYPNGYKESEGKYKNGYKVGIWKRWDYNGNPKPDRYYSDEGFTAGSRLTKPAKFPGGMTALQAMVNDSLKYPEEARNRKIEGTVTVTFTIDATGEVSKPQVTDGVHYLLDEEALRFVSSLPTWTPAAKNGMPVDSNFIMPITFNLGSYYDKQQVHSNSTNGTIKN